ncbi:MAG: STAS domain-containing protein [Anaerolineae bacterium]|nr:STAS domain-containing protein [Anaerolineae bacterium]
MELTVKEYKHCDVIKVNGRINTQTAPELKAALEALMENGRYKFVLDLSEVEFISTAGLRVLMSAQKTCKQLSRGEVVLAGVPERVHEALDLAGFVSLFKIEETILDAVGNF